MALQFGEGKVIVGAIQLFVKLMSHGTREEFDQLPFREDEEFTVKGKWYRSRIYPTVVFQQLGTDTKPCWDAWCAPLPTGSDNLWILPNTGR